jgi:glucan-binding YG repeat protein
MLKKIMFYSFFSIFVLSFFMGTSVSADIDEEGYEYRLAKASEIDFAEEDIFITLYSGEPNDENALYAVYTNEELERYKKDKILKNNSTLRLLQMVESEGYSSYYYSSIWLLREGIISLSIDPKMNAWIGSSLAGNVFKEKDRWDVLVARHSAEPYWRNSASLRAQLNCHCDLAKSLKTPWNLESDRTTTNYAIVLASGCNAANKDSSGVIPTGWIQESGKWYHLNSEGLRQIRWIQVSGKWYYLNTSGVMQTGWIQELGKWYYLNSSGEMLTGWQLINSKWYYLNAAPDGSMVTGWRLINSKWYYFNAAPDGSMVTGWKWVDGKCYYFYSNGSMAVNTTIDGSTVGSDGAWIQ